MNTSGSLQRSIAFRVRNCGGTWRLHGSDAKRVTPLYLYIRNLDEVHTSETIFWDDLLDEKLIKRVIVVPGDTVKLHGRKVLANKQSEKNTQETKPAE